MKGAQRAGFVSQTVIVVVRFLASGDHADDICVVTMGSAQIHTATVEIKNKLGLHVRPIQRFVELAQVFHADVEVRIGERKGPGKSVINLMGLAGHRGDEMKISAAGEDAEQCICALRYLVENAFFVEDDLDCEKHPLRHLRRLATMASCFRSDVRVELDGKSADAKEFSELCRLGITPRSELSFQVSGEDSDQVRKLLEKLVQYRFYVEEELIKEADKPGN